MAPPPILLPRRLLVGGVTAAAKPVNFFHCSLLGIGLRSPLPSSSTTRSSSIRCFSSKAEQPTGPGTRSRRWWSDDQFGDDGEEFEEHEEEEFEGSSFGGSASWDQAFDEPWFTKASRAYGYVLPVILVSLLVATGPQAFLMAMAIPLAQSAVSFAIRAFSNTFGRRRDDQAEYDVDDDYYSDYRSSDWEAQEEEEEDSNTSSSSSTKYNYRYGGSGSRSQQPCAKDDKSEDSEPTAEPDDTDGASASSSNSTSKRGTSGAGFGGWDELDADADADEYSRSSSSRRSTGATTASHKATGGGAARSVGRRRPQPETTARGRRPRSRAAAAARYRQSPLFMRLLVALFPFLGSWFRIML